MVYIQYINMLQAPKYTDLRALLTLGKFRAN